MGPMRMHSPAHNNYLLLGVVMQHIESRSIQEVHKDGLECESSLLLLTFTRVSSRDEHLVSLFSVRRSDCRCKYAVGRAIDAVAVCK